MSEHAQRSRRNFLKIAGGALLTAVVAGGGVIALGTRQPIVELPEASYKGANAMQRKMLVAYASKCGSTAEVANVIGQVLSAKGVTVDVRQVNTVTDVSDYQAVIIGSAIRMGGWLSAAKKFVKTHQHALRAKPTAYFAVCLSLKDDTAENRQKAAQYLDAVRTIVTPKEEGLFAGKMDYRTLSWLDRLISEKMIKAPEGDFRNWDAIRAWAEKLPATLA